jgi:DivIVA domain-containing protein
MARKDKNRRTAPEPAGEAGRVTPADIQQKEFRESFRGYNEREVDEFLDRVTEEIARLHAENKRLQEQSEFRQTIPLNADAEEVLRRDRDEAERVVADARARASRIGGPEERPGGGSSPSVPPSAGLPAEAIDMINRYLGREREFLQALRSTVQQHIEAVKEDARVARDLAEASGSHAMGAGPSDMPGVAAGFSGSAEETGSYPAFESQADPPDQGGADLEADPPAVGATTPDDADEEAGRLDGETWSGPGGEPASADGVFESASSWGRPEDAGQDAGASTQQWQGPPAGEASAAGDPDPAGPSEVDGSSAQSVNPWGPVAARTRSGLKTPASREVRATAAPEDDAGQERSLKELFWGED